MPARLATLRAKARNGLLEVEDLPRVARYPDDEMAAAIDALARDCGWEFGASLPEVPLREWAHVVAEYCRGGEARLIEIGRDDRLLPFVIGLLEEGGGNEPLRCLVEAADRVLARPDLGLAAAHRLAAALNLLCVRKWTAADPAAVDAAKVRVFLHRLLGLARSDAERGTTLYALRHFGDASSLPLIAALPALAPQWEGARAAAKRAIAKKARRARP